MECGSLPSTVRHAATIACPITCPPNTRCQLVFGLLPRNRFTSMGSRSRIEIRSIRLFDILLLGPYPLLPGVSARTRILYSFFRIPGPRGSPRPGIAAEGLVSPPVSPSYSSVARASVSRPLMSAQRSIVIGGGAFTGLALALALREGLGPDIGVIVADPALASRPSRDPRATAIVAACRRLFETIGVWGEVADHAQPILDMVVTDSRLEDATRPVFLTFAGNVEPGEPFAHMVENRHLIDALVKRAEAAGVELRATPVSSYDSRADGISVTFGDGSTVDAAL